MGPPSKVAGAVCLLYFFVGGSFAGPVRNQNEKCLNGLPVGQSLVYRYAGRNKITNDDIDQQVAFVSDVIVSVDRECTLTVQLRNVESPHKKFAEALEKHPVEVRMDNGLVKGLKHHPSDPVWVVNAKRAIVSMLQAPLDARNGKVESTETDILGECDTTYTIDRDSDDLVVVKKTKKLLSCQGRFQNGKAVFFTPYNAPNSDIRTAPLADGTFDCEQVLSKSTGVVSTSICIQREKLYLSQQASSTPGVISEILSEATMELIRQEEAASGMETSEFRPTSLAFDHRYSHEHSAESLVIAVNRYCEAMKDDIRPETGKLFNELLKAMRSASYEKVLGVYEMIDSKNCNTEKLRTAFLDVLGMAGTPGAVGVMAGFLERREMAAYEQKWLASLAYLTNPTEEMIQAMIPIVEKASAEKAKMVYLPVSAMANTFCKNYGSNCDQVPAIQALTSVLVGRLQNGCTGERAHVVAALKSLGNLGAPGEYSRQIMQCLLHASTDIRLYTLTAFRKVCTPELTQQMVTIYADQAEDAEVRIAAYLNAMRCADSETVGQIVSVYETEKTIQVGSFVYSHMKSVHDSSCPLKASLKQLIAAFPVSAKFSNDPSKFSQHYEFSKFFEEVNTGASADASVVFSPKSFLPRSASLNLSLDVFSNSLNLLELGGRIEGLEQFVEEAISASAHSMYRSKRSASEITDVEKFDNDVKVGGEREEKLAFYVNVHGNEINFVEFSSVQELMASLQQSAFEVLRLHPSNLMSEMIVRGKVDIAKNLVLVDTRVTAATVSGLGLVTDLRAVSNVVMKASVPAERRSNSEEFKVTIEPSAVVQIDASLTLDGGVFRHGARVASTVHTSSVVDVVITTSNNNLKFRFNTPRDKIELINAKSEVFAIHGDGEKAIKAEKTRDLNGCTIQLTDLIGMKACISGTVPKPWYVAGRGFVKPFDFSLTLEKVDQNMEGIELSVSKDASSVSFMFNTPGSTVNRNHIARFQADQAQGNYGIFVETPSIIWTLKTHSFGPHRYGLISSEFENKQTSKKTVYSARMEFGSTNDVVIEAQCPHLEQPARLTIDFGAKSLEVNSNYPIGKPLSFKANIERSRANYTVTSTLSVADIEASSKLSYRESSEMTVVSFKTDYSLGEGTPTQKLAYDLRIRELDRTSSNYQVNVISTWTATCHPQYNHKINLDAQSIGDSRKHKMQIWWDSENFDEEESKTFRVNIDAKKKGDFGFGQVSTIQIGCQVFSPVWNINWDAKYNNKVDLQRSVRVTSELLVTSERKKIVEFEFVYDRVSPKTLVKISLLAPHTLLKFHDVSEEIADGKYKGTTDVEWGSEGKKLSIDYTTQLLRNGNHELMMNVRAPNMKPIQHRHLIRLARDVTLQTETMIDGKEYIVFEMKKEDKSMAFNFVGQKVNIKYSREVKDKAVDVKLDIVSKIVYTRPIKLVIHKDSPGKRTHNLNVDLMWDAVANPDRKLSIVLNTNREDGVKTDAKIEIASLVNFSYKGVYVKGFIKGPNRAEFSLSGPKIEARELVVGHTHSMPEGEGYLTYTRGGKQLIDARVGHQFTDAKRYYYLTVTGVVTRKLTINRDLTNRVLTVELDRDGKIYHLVVDRKSDYSKGIIDTKVTLKLPYEKFKSQELTAKGTFADGKVDLTINFLSGTEKNYNFVVKGTRPGALQLDVEIAIKTDNEKLKEGKAHLKYNLAEAASREASLTVESEGTNVVDFSLKTTGTDAYNREIVAKLASKWSPSIEYQIKVAGSSKQFTTDTLVNKEGKEYFTSHVEIERGETKMSYLGKYKGGYFNLDMSIHAERNILAGDNHRTYKLHITRNDKELKADVETQRVNGEKLTTCNICRTPLDSNCVSIQVKRNVANFNFFRNNALNVKIHRKPDVTVEFDHQMHIPDDVHKAHVRFLGSINELKLGMEYSCDHSTEQLSEQALKGYIVDRELLATRRREQTDKFIDIKYTASFDSKSEERLEATYRRDFTDKGYKSVAKLAHPKMRAPMVLTSELSRGKDENSIIRLESELEWFKPEDKVFFHYERRVNDITPRNRSVHIHIHKQDMNDFNLHFTAYRSQDLQKPVFGGYYWSYITAKKEQRVGSLKAFLGEDLKGSIEFTSPYQDDFTITGEAKVVNDDGDKEAEIVHLKNGVETKGKISYNLQKVYMKAVVLDAAGAEKRELEIDGGRKDKGRYKVVLSSFPEGKRTTDLGMEHTMSSETSFQTRVYMPPEYIQRVAERAKEMAATRAGKYPIESIKEELKARAEVVAFKLKKTFEDVPEYMITKVSQIIVEIQGSLGRLINNTTVGQRLKQRLEANKEKIAQMLKCLIDFVRKCCPQVADKLEKNLEPYMPKRTRRSVEEEKINLVQYVMERVDMFTEWVMDFPVVRAVVNGFTGAVNAVDSFVVGWYEAAKKAFFDIPDVKQVATTWAELYDSSSVGYLLPRDAVMKYIIMPRLEGWKVRRPTIDIDRKAGRFVADVDVPVDAKELIQYWAYGVKPRSRQTIQDENLSEHSPLEMIVATIKNKYGALATVIDGKHFITFDNKHFSAAGECSYLLARDFEHGRFSVVMKDGGSSYFMQVGSNSIEVSIPEDADNEDVQVTVNRQPVTRMPAMFSGKVLVSSNSMGRVVIRNEDIMLKVYPERRIVTLEMATWFFGKTAGLFGNFNREPSDDFVSSVGKALESEQEFLRAWEMNQGCRSKTMVFQQRTQEAEALEMCHRVFQSEESPLVFGFLLRNPDQYYDLCLRVAHGAAKVEGICQVAHAYLLDIERYADLPGYLGVRLPNECRK